MPPRNPKSLVSSFVIEGCPFEPSQISRPLPPCVVVRLPENCPIIRLTPDEARELAKALLAEAEVAAPGNASVDALETLRRAIDAHLIDPVLIDAPTDADRLAALEEASTWMPKDAGEVEDVENDIRDAARYRRLRVLGAAPSHSKHLENGTVLCFTNLDEFVDQDIALHPSRGEAT